MGALEDSCGTDYYYEEELRSYVSEDDQPQAHYLKWKLFLSKLL